MTGSELGFALLELYGQAEEKCESCKDNLVCGKFDRLCDWGMVHIVYAATTTRAKKNCEKDKTGKSE